MTAFFICCNAFAQNKTSQNYPVFANPNISVADKEAIDANQLYKGQMVRFAISVVNPSQSDVVKAGSCELQIELGDKMKPVHKDVLLKMALNNYFSWSAITDEKGIMRLNGKLTADLPADFVGTAFVDLQCMEAGSSAVRVQWLDAHQLRKGALNAVDFTIKKTKPKD